MCALFQGIPWITLYKYPCTEQSKSNCFWEKNSTVFKWYFFTSLNTLCVEYWRLPELVKLEHRTNWKNIFKYRRPGTTKDRDNNYITILNVDVKMRKRMLRVWMMHYPSSMHSRRKTVLSIGIFNTL